MTGPFDRVPALPVVIPIGLLLFAVLLWRLHTRQLLSVPRASVAGALAVYAGGILATTLFPVYLGMPRADEPWTPGLALVPFHDYEFADALTNVLVFLPLGILIPLLLAYPSWWKVLAWVVAVSLTIELSQLAAQKLVAGGHIADVNDFIFNTVGGAVGYAIFMILTRVPGLDAFVERFRWTQPTSAPEDGLR